MHSIPPETIVHNNALPPEVEAAIARLGIIRATERDTMVALRFEAGDIFNRMHFESGSRAVQLQERYGEGDYEYFRHCAWVAYRWPKRERVKDKPWRYFRDGLPGEQDRTPRIPSYDQSDTRWEGTAAYVFGTNSRGKSVKVRVTPDSLRVAADDLERNTP